MIILAMIAAIQNPDERRLAEQLYHEYCQPMFRIAYGILRDASKAEDAVADAFEKIIRNLGRFQGLDCNKTRGLIVIFIRSVCFNALRREKILEFTQLEEMAALSPAVDDFVISREDLRALEALVATLDEKYREVLVLKYFMGYQDSEIAQICGITHQNVRVRLHRAKVQAVRLLEERRQNEQEQ